ncbi:unnamed protein product [Rhizophagus irregularis]|nr:unnamed protein product [Rhizophagus irregularis]
MGLIVNFTLGSTFGSWALDIWVLTFGSWVLDRFPLRTYIEQIGFSLRIFGWVSLSDFYSMGFSFGFLSDRVSRR